LGGERGAAEQGERLGRERAAALGAAAAANRPTTTARPPPAVDREVNFESDPGTRFETCVCLSLLEPAWACVEGGARRSDGARSSDASIATAAGNEGSCA
jgi:hypothetical protein